MEQQSRQSLLHSLSRLPKREGRRTQVLYLKPKKRGNQCAQLSHSSQGFICAHVQKISSLSLSLPLSLIPGGISSGEKPRKYSCLSLFSSSNGVKSLIPEQPDSSSQVSS